MSSCLPRNDVGALGAWLPLAQFLQPHGASLPEADRKSQSRLRQPTSGVAKWFGTQTVPEASIAGVCIVQNLTFEAIWDRGERIEPIVETGPVNCH